jgi:hypothetical protein
MNIILCNNDKLRYDYLGANVNPWIQTPNMSCLAEKTVIFDRAFTASYPTIPQHTDVMTGRYGNPSNPWTPLRFDIATIMRLIAEQDIYCTPLIHDTPHLVNGGHAFDWPFNGWTFIRGSEVDRPWIDDQGLTYLNNWKCNPEFDFLGDPAFENIADPTTENYTLSVQRRERLGDWNAANILDRRILLIIGAGITTFGIRRRI